MRKSGFHHLAALVPIEKKNPEITEKLDAIVGTALKATPASPRREA